MKGLVTFIPGEPPRRTGYPANKYRPLWEEIVRELQEVPGVWADVWQTKSPSDTAARIFLKEQGCEVTQRKLKEDGLVHIYARWPVQ